ncbi:MAG: UDP-N-acetylglucosamine 1-carboxyvinyltransferase [Lachnospiraceae bacterium]|nr:UDP-N-acetylglucosamine 1-carboxyvinyltransferase [Lachnospiraceae bacterium]
MSSIIVQGRTSLKGSVKIQGSKNAVLPMMAAAILIDGVCRLDNCPHISDVEDMAGLLRQAGCVVTREDNALIIDATRIKEDVRFDESVARIRSSVILLGAMLGRCGRADLCYPGGCIIGRRPVDFHTMALERLGVTFSECSGRLCAEASKLQGNSVYFPFPSVGATQNALLAAVRAHGVTRLVGCAREPEITALCLFLKRAGAKIGGVGTGELTIEGGDSLKGIRYDVEADRIVAGTYLLAVAGAGGEAFLKKAPVSQMNSVMEVCRQMGASVEAEEEGIHIRAKHSPRPVSMLETQVYPGFPTDLQSPVMTVLTKAGGPSRLRETIFTNRFHTAGELRKMGARIHCSQRDAWIRGNDRLTGALVEARELRGGAALVMAGIMAEGRTCITGCRYIARGYENIVRDFRCLGAVIEERPGKADHL